MSDEEKRRAAVSKQPEPPAGYRLLTDNEKRTKPIPSDALVAASLGLRWIEATDARGCVTGTPERHYATAITTNTRAESPELAQLRAEVASVRQNAAQEIAFREDHIDALKAQLSTATARIAELEKELKEAQAEAQRAWGCDTSHVAQLAIVCGQRAELESEAARLREDGKRLDKLEELARSYRSGLVATVAPAEKPGWRWLVENSYGDSLRAAIDAAMSERSGE